ncbi:MAG: hypothetical protein JW787_17425 [Sedimentisphaerales bacterium]|nr:hypothetical protein [Sedimentisphaerales bacterium]
MTFINKWIFIIMLVLLLCTGIVYSNDSTGDKKQAVMRFDTVLELKSPQSGASVLLFARYWVSKDFYSIGFKWAEPQAGNLNFPTYPGVTISSNEKEFSTSSQIIESHNIKFPKPIEERGVFRHALGSYHFGDIRFAEPETLASRIYKKDIAGVPEPNNNQAQTIEIADSNNSKGIKRNIKKLEMKRGNGNIDNLRVFDANGFLLKDINYEYVGQDGKSMLKHQTVLMPEKRMMVGFNGNGVTITLRGQKKTFKELPGFHHTGARKCDIDYEMLKTDKGLLAVPSSIVVKRADVNYTLRTAKMSNITKLKMTQEEAQKEALEFGRLNDKELKVRELFERYWQKKPQDINDIDRIKLESLRKNFESANTDSKSAAEKLRNISMILELDWIQDDPNLQKHFEQYLTILKENNFKEMLLLGGLNVINTTAGWSRFSDTDKLLQKWFENTIKSYKQLEILSFSEAQINQNNYWIIIRLLDSYMEANKNSETELFDIQAMKCTALSELNKLIADQSKIKRNNVRLQVEWALNSRSKEELIKLANESLVEVQKTFSKLKEPNQIQISLKKKLDQIEGKN